MKSIKWNTKFAVSLALKALLTRKNKTIADLCWVFWNFGKLLKNYEEQNIRFI